MAVPLTLKVFKGDELVVSKDYDRDIIKIGRLASAHLKLDDTLFTLKLTPNLGHCLSVFGLAREVSALLIGTVWGVLEYAPPYRATAARPRPDGRAAGQGPRLEFQSHPWPALMPGSSFGDLFRVTNFGESHGPAIGCVIDGCPPGMELSEADITKMPPYYCLLSGTSMATPVTAGCAALVMQANPDLTPAQVKQVLIESETKQVRWPDWFARRPSASRPGRTSSGRRCWETATGLR